MLSAVAVFYAARRYGARFLASRIGRRLLSQKAQQRLERAWERHHAWGLFVSRFLPGYRAVVPPFSAALGLPARRALPPVIAASALYYAILTWACWQLGSNWDAVKNLISGIGIGLLIAALVVTVVGGWLVWRYRRKHRDG